jgi:ABC-type multidrug transport system ATPase subunit
VKEGIVDDVIDILGLRDIENSIIGDELNRGISGGQRKRVNIGIELVADPSVLFLDEPTSGLDSASSKDICHAIQSLTQLGMTVRASIHDLGD